MPRRISDYPDAYAGWNAISSFGSIISVVATIIFLQLTYSHLTNGSAVTRYPWAIPQFFTDFLQSLSTRAFPSLEWALQSPPKPHAFASLPLQSNSLSTILAGLYILCEAFNFKPFIFKENIKYLSYFIYNTLFIFKEKIKYLFSFIYNWYCILKIKFFGFSSFFIIVIVPLIILKILTKYVCIQANSIPLYILFILIFVFSSFVVVFARSNIKEQKVNIVDYIVAGVVSIFFGTLFLYWHLSDICCFGLLSVYFFQYSDIRIPLYYFYAYGSLTLSERSSSGLTDTSVKHWDSISQQSPPNSSPRGPSNSPDPGQSTSVYALGSQDEEARARRVRDSEVYTHRYNYIVHPEIDNLSHEEFVKAFVYKPEGSYPNAWGWYKWFDRRLENTTVLVKHVISNDTNALARLAHYDDRQSIYIRRMESMRRGGEPFLREFFHLEDLIIKANMKALNAYMENTSKRDPMIRDAMKLIRELENAKSECNRVHDQHYSRERLSPSPSR